MGCERIVCAGDLVDYGKHPEKTLAFLRERRVPCIRDNYDRWALKAEGFDDPDLGLSPGSLRFLESLPRRLDSVIDGVRIAVRHARPPEETCAGSTPTTTTRTTSARCSMQERGGVHPQLADHRVG